MNSCKIGFFIDPVHTLNPDKDTTLLLINQAEKMGCETFIFTLKDLYLEDSIPYANLCPISVVLENSPCYKLKSSMHIALSKLDVILIRKDPPFDSEYLYATMILNIAQNLGVLVSNNPSSLQMYNEKLYTLLFKKFIPPTIISQHISKLMSFINFHKHVVLKPLNEMGGTSIFNITKNDINKNVILETLTNNESSFIMCQKFIPEVVQGDKRIIIIDGEPISFTLARFPKHGDFRGNLAKGGHGKVQELSSDLLNIAKEIGQTFKRNGLHFVGIDMLGTYLTEINITSPTCVREIQTQADINIAEKYLNFLRKKCNK